MEKGWDATGRLKPLWERVGGRDALAELTGIRGQTLSAYNTGPHEGGRRLGPKNAAKIASALKISIYDLGASRPTTQAFLLTLLGQIATEIRRDAESASPSHLQELATELRELASDLEAVAEERSAGGLP